MLIISTGDPTMGRVPFRLTGLTGLTGPSIEGRPLQQTSFSLEYALCGVAIPDEELAPGVETAIPGKVKLGVTDLERLSKRLGEAMARPAILETLLTVVTWIESGRRGRGGVAMAPLNQTETVLDGCARTVPPYTSW